MRKLKRLLRVAKITLGIFFCIVFIPVVVALVRTSVECRVFARGGRSTAGPAANRAIAPPEILRIKESLGDYARSEDQTYLTLPEWYIVYSSDEYAAFLGENRPSAFPYFRAIGQFWGSYHNVCAVTREQYGFNTGYHLSLMVIGTSFTIENIVKGLYENTFGRVTEWLSSSELSEEDAYARKVAEEYGAFLHTIPWYEFPFGAKLKGLWGETSLWGPNVIRKWERKVALSVEYGSKAVYGWLIGLGTRGVYRAEDLRIYAWVDGVPDVAVRQERQLQIVRMVDSRNAIVALPRYEAFTQIVPRLARQGMRFVDIAGNDEILITAFAPQAWTYDVNEGSFLFAMPILTQPEVKRVAVKVPVRSLHLVLNELERRSIQLEHIYDY